MQMIRQNESLKAVREREQHFNKEEWCFVQQSDTHTRCLQK